MAVESSIGEFLRNRRARLSPGDVGIVEGITTRRVPGLRREEVAHLAGVSVDYYIRLEQGRSKHVSVAVLDTVAKALRLNEFEREHLHNLAHPPRVSAVAAPARPLAPAILRLLDQLDDAPTIALGSGMRALAWNNAATDVLAVANLRDYDFNSARYLFLAEQARQLYRNWWDVAADVTAQLRFDSGRHPGDPELAALVGELSIRSPDFARLWTDIDVRPKSQGRTVVLHPDVGELDLVYHTLHFADDPSTSLVVYSFEKGSPTDDRYRLLRSWHAHRSEETDLDADALPASTAEAGEAFGGKRFKSR